MASSADIVIGGGSAGAGKTVALLLEFTRHHDVKDWGGVIFRRTGPQIKSEGGLWDTSMRFYPLIGAIPKESTMEWKFKRAKLKFSHLEYEKNVLDWQGSQIPFIGIDELTHFSKYMFFYLLSRNRSTCGIKPYVRATCNPDPDSWVATFIEWFIDQETGFPISERCGKLRYFIVQNDNYVWGDTKAEVIEKCPDIHKISELNNIDINDLIKSMTFIPGSIYGNKELLKVNPEYLANLLSQDDETKAQLLEGNWKIRTDGLGMFEYNAINNVFSNYADTTGLKCITCDAARFGRDLMVIRVWNGYTCVKYVVEYKSEAHDIVRLIEQERKNFGIQKSDVLVDQDGVGDGTVKLGGYVGFHGGAQPLKDPKSHIKENYKNLKTQCAYRYANLVNEGKICEQVNNETCIVGGIRGTKVKMGSKVVDIRDLIIADYRSFKKDKIDMDGKTQMIPKEQQKIILNGRSPDFGDSGIMRCWFDLRVKRYDVGSVPASV